MISQLFLFYNNTALVKCNVNTLAKTEGGKIFELNSMLNSVGLTNLWSFVWVELSFLKATVVSCVTEIYDKITQEKLQGSPSNRSYLLLVYRNS